jgi:DnaK suppressor protein
MPRTSSAADATGSTGGPELYRALLERQWRSQLDAVTRLSLELAEAHGNGEGPSTGGALELTSVTRRLLAAARVQLAETEAALCRLDEGRYGTCAACQGAIARGRLEALPTARLCVACMKSFRNTGHSDPTAGSRSTPASVPF